MTDTGTEIDTGEVATTENVRLSEWLWRGSESQALAQKALQSEFIKGIKSGQLDSRQFDSFFGQDAIFCSHLIQHLKIALRKSLGDSTLTAVFHQQIRTNEEYSRDLFQQWHIADPNGISLGKAAEDYIEFQREVAEDMNPMYMLIASLSCVNLWRWLAKEIQPEIKSTNVYRFWVEKQLIGINSVGLLSTSTFIDNNAERYNVDRDTAMFVYQKVLYSEVKFFETATP